MSDSNPLQEVEKTFQQYVETMKSVDADSVASFWAEDAKFVTAQEDIDGREGILNFLKSLYEGLTIHDIKITSAKTDVGDKIVVDVSNYTETISYQGGEKQTLTGKQVTVWKKVGDEWKISIVSITPTSPDDVHELF